MAWIVCVANRSMVFIRDKCNTVLRERYANNTVNKQYGYDSRQYAIASLFK